MGTREHVDGGCGPVYELACAFAARIELDELSEFVVEKCRARPRSRRCRVHARWSSRSRCSWLASDRPRGNQRRERRRRTLVHRRSGSEDGIRRLRRFGRSRRSIRRSAFRWSTRSRRTSEDAGPARCDPGSRRARRQGSGRRRPRPPASRSARPCDRHGLISSNPASYTQGGGTSSGVSIAASVRAPSSTRTMVTCFSGM